MDVVEDPRPVCLRCRRPEAFCWCPHVTEIDTRTRIVILQHPRERDVAFGTARMANRCLPNAVLHVGLRFEEAAPVTRALSDPARPAVLLYPGPDTLDIEATPPEGPVTLVVLDGTWSQSRKLLQHNPRVAALPRYAFVPPAPSRYRIRREPRADYVSTIEALAHVLGILEGSRDRFRPLLAPFGWMIDTQIAHTQALRAGRTHDDGAPKAHRPLLPAPLRGAASRIVCVAAESNARAGGAGSDAGREHGLLHWAAQRLGEDDLLDVTRRPPNALSPPTPEHAELPDSAILTGETLPALLRRWGAFLREDDVLCSWGRYAPDLMAKAGGPLPPRRFDLRQVLRSRTAPPFGPLEAWVERCGASPSPCRARGRAGRRLRELAGLLEHLRRRE